MPQLSDFNVPVIDDINFDQAQQRRDELIETLANHGVMCLRIRQKLEKSELLAFARLFGDVKMPIGTTKSGGEFQYSPERQVIDSGYVPTQEDREKYDLDFGGLDEDRPGLFETYHCDDTFSSYPAQFTILHARALPPSGGGPTHFMDMRAAYHLLDEQEQHFLKQLMVHYAYNNTVDGQNPFPPRQPAKGEGECLIDVEHPMVRRHPIANTLALFIDLDRATHIADMDPEQGRHLLAKLQQHAEDNAPKCRHNWQDYDILIWDNASVQHKADGNFVVGEPRRFWRHLINGATVQPAGLQ